MADTHTDVLVGGYPDIDAATKDFDALAKLVEDKKVEMEAAILITHAEDGTVTVAQTADHRGRKGVEWGGTVGVLVGLAAPPLLAATAVGAAAGGLVGRFVDKRVETRDARQDRREPAAGHGRDHRRVRRFAAARRRAGAAGRAREVDRADGQEGHEGAQGRSRRGDGQVRPRPHGAADPDRNFGGTIGRTIDQSVPDWTIIPGPKAPQDAPNVLLILIDDAGFGQPDTFGGPVATPEPDARRADGPLLQPLPRGRAVLADAGGDAHGAQPASRRHGLGRRVPGPFPGYTGAVPKSCAAVPRILKENGYVTGGFGKWHMTPDREQGAAGPFEHWPQNWGFNHFWGFLSGAAGQWDPLLTQDNTNIGVPEGTDGKPYYFPDDLTDKSVEWLHAVRAQDPEKPWFLYYSTGCAHAPHHVAKEWADKYKGKFDQGWDAIREEVFERQKKLGVIPQDAELTPSGPISSTRGTRSTTPRRSSTRGRWRSTQGSWTTPTGTSAACSTRSRRWATSTTR